MDVSDRESRLQHGEDGTSTEGDSSQLIAEAHERSSTGERSSWSGWGGDAGGIDGNRWNNAGRDLLDLAIGDLLDGGSDSGGGGGGDLLDLAVGDLLDNGRCGSRLLDLTIGDLLDLSISNLGLSEGRGSEGQDDEDFLDGRHCE